MSKATAESISLICFSIALVFGVLSWIDDGTRGQSQFMLPSMYASIAGIIWTTRRFLLAPRSEKNADEN